LTTYRSAVRGQSLPSGSDLAVVLACDEGDLALSGGFDTQPFVVIDQKVSHYTVHNFWLPDLPQAWRWEITNSDAFDTTMDFDTICLDTAAPVNNFTLATCTQTVFGIRSVFFCRP
jgi:hypothetical protein